MDYKKQLLRQQQIARERIEILLNEAKKAFKSDAKQANRYVEIARRVAMKARIKVPSNLKRQFCKHCFSYLMPGKNCRVRLAGSKVVYYCLNCKKYTRFPYVIEQKKRRKK
jgi:ribonuclease P protein subunit RPR2